MFECIGGLLRGHSVIFSHHLDHSLRSSFAFALIRFNFSVLIEVSHTSPKTDLMAREDTTR